MEHPVFQGKLHGVIHIFDIDNFHPEAKTQFGDHCGVFLKNRSIEVFDMIADAPYPGMVQRGDELRGLLRNNSTVTC